MSRPLKKDQSKPSPVLVDPTSLVGRSCRDDSKTGFRSQQGASRLKLPAYPEFQREKGSCQAVLNNTFDVPVQEGNSRIASVGVLLIRW
ncbi:hypothetical protein Y032_0170g255 [Ancylostoma ceylanicum]|uniref:Uncharacterized protein n=1 Tax=Ancylostoma ceylanicum TaxID=53326 RepID=A0A016SV45_9BILA|nr:hypothetical protein Y032_0170g255 [Ancylostoma ceylanicum]